MGHHHHIHHHHHHQNPTTIYSHRIPFISYYALNSSHRPKAYDQTDNDSDGLSKSKYFSLSNEYNQRKEPIYDKAVFSLVSAFNDFFNENVYWYL